MSNPTHDIINRRFDRLLSSYQKVCFLTVLPPLVSAFACAVGFFNHDFMQQVLCMGITLGMRNQMGLDPVYPFLFALSLTALTVYFALKGAKGKLPFFLGNLGIYASDLIYGLFLYGVTEIGVYVSLIVIHGLFLFSYGVGVVFYVKADRLLKAHKDVILKS